MTYLPGDPGHIDVHNDLVAEVDGLASRAPVEVVLPPVRSLGDSGHVDDHNLFTVAIQAIADAGGGFPWAKVSGGTVTTVNNPDGSVDEVHTFTANGTLTVDEPGYARVLCVGTGGGSFSSNYGNGGGGAVLDELASLPGGSLPVTIGAGLVAGPGGDASLGSVVVASGGKGGTRTDESPGRAGAGGMGADGGIGLTNWGGGAAGKPSPWSGVVSDISGTAVEYGKGGNNNDGITGPQTPGQGGATGANGNLGYPGIVIVRVQQSPPTESGIVASGGTESTYVGDGTNGVLGQSYKVHKFTAGGTLTVTQEGMADVLICAGGGVIGGSLESGGGGGVIETQVYLTAGSHTVVRGPKGTPPASNSRLDDLVAVGGQNPQSRYPGGSGDGYGYADGFTAGQGYQGNSALKAGAGAGGPATTNAGGPGLPSYIDGTLKQYGHGGSSQDTGIVYTDPGAGESRSPTGAVGGTAGVVVIRYPVTGT